MNEEDFRQVFREASPPPVRLEAQMEAVKRARRAWEESKVHSTEPVLADSRVQRFPVFAFASIAGLAAVVLIATAIFWGNPGKHPEVAMDEGTGRETEAFVLDREKNILREMEGLFEDRLQFIVLKNGQTHIEVAANPVSREQPVMLELRHGDELWRVISYSGNTVQLKIQGELFEFDVLVAGDGEVIMAGADFIWSSRLGSHSGKLSIEASIISG